MNRSFVFTEMASPQQNYSEPSLSQRRRLVIEMPSPRQLVESKGEVQYIHKRPPKAPLKPPSSSTEAPASSPEGEGGHPDENAKVNAKDNGNVSDNANVKASLSLCSPIPYFTIMKSYWP